MPTYEYECRQCGLRFEKRQPMTDGPLAECPECGARSAGWSAAGLGSLLKGRVADRPNTAPAHVPWNEVAKRAADGTIAAASLRAGENLDRQRRPIFLWPRSIAPSGKELGDQ